MQNPIFYKTNSGTWVVMGAKGFDTCVLEFQNYAEALDHIRPARVARVQDGVPQKCLKTSSGEYLTIRYLDNGYQEVREWSSEAAAMEFLNPYLGDDNAKPF